MFLRHLWILQTLCSVTIILKLKLSLNTLTSKLHFSKIPKKVKKVSSMFDPWSIWIYNIGGGGATVGTIILGTNNLWKNMQRLLIALAWADMVLGQ